MSSQCQCFTLSGKQCTRTVLKNSKYCWQHQSCRLKSSVKPCKSLKKNINPKLLENVYMLIGDQLSDVKLMDFSGQSPNKMRHLKQSELDTPVIDENPVTLVLENPTLRHGTQFTKIKTGNTLGEILSAIINWQNEMISRKKNIFGDYDLFQMLQKETDPVSHQIQYSVIYGAP